MHQHQIPVLWWTPIAKPQSGSWFICRWFCEEPGQGGANGDAFQRRPAGLLFTAMVLAADEICCVFNLKNVISECYPEMKDLFEVETLSIQA